MLPIRKLPANQYNRYCIFEAQRESKCDLAPERVDGGYSPSGILKFWSDYLGKDQVAVKCGNLLYCLGPSLTGKAKEIYDRAIPLGRAFSG